MTRLSLSTQRLRTALGVALVATTLFALSNPPAFAADPTSTNAPPPAAKPESKPKQPKKLTGQELYAINCGRCHPERYPTEFNATQWKTLLTHMRVRANLPAKQAKEILKYLQEEAGN